MIALGLQNWQTDDEWRQVKPIQVEASPKRRQTARHNCLILPHLGTFDDTLCSEEIRSNHGTWWNYSTSGKAMPNYLQGIYQVASSAIFNFIFPNAFPQFECERVSLLAWLCLAWWLTELVSIQASWTGLNCGPACSATVRQIFPVMTLSASIGFPGAPTRPQSEQAATWNGKLSVYIKY